MPSLAREPTLRCGELFVSQTKELAPLSIVKKHTFAHMSPQAMAAAFTAWEDLRRQQYACYNYYHRVVGAFYAQAAVVSQVAVLTEVPPGLWRQPLSLAQWLLAEKGVSRSAFVASSPEVRRQLEHLYRERVVPSVVEELIAGGDYLGVRPAGGKAAPSAECGAPKLTQLPVAQWQNYLGTALRLRGVSLRLTPVEHRPGLLRALQGVELGSKLGLSGSPKALAGARSWEGLKVFCGVNPQSYSPAQESDSESLKVPSRPIPLSKLEPAEPFSPKGRKPVLFKKRVPKREWYDGLLPEKLRSELRGPTFKRHKIRRLGGKRLVRLKLSTLSPTAASWLEKGAGAPTAPWLEKDAGAPARVRPGESPVKPVFPRMELQPELVGVLPRRERADGLADATEFRLGGLGGVAKPPRDKLSVLVEPDRGPVKRLLKRFLPKGAKRRSLRLRWPALSRGTTPYCQSAVRYSEAQALRRGRWQALYWHEARVKEQLSLGGYALPAPGVLFERNGSGLYYARQYAQYQLWNPLLR